MTDTVTPATFTENPTLSEFINKPFSGYNKNMLPKGYRENDVDTFIKSHAEIVVKITDKGGNPRGSGIVLKLGKKICIQTSYHIFRKVGRDWNSIKISFGKDKFAGIKACLGGCQHHDMVLLTLKGIAEDTEPLDITHQGVDIAVDGQLFKGLVEYHRGEHRFVVHALKFTQRQLDEKTEITCNFVNVGTKATCNMRNVCYCSETGCAIIFLDSDKIPDSVKNMFLSQGVWEEVRRPLVVLLSYPGEKDKHISTGNVMHGVYDMNGFAQYETSERVCFEIDNTKCHLGDSVGISKRPEERVSGLGQQTDQTRNIHEVEIVGKAEGLRCDTKYELVNSNGNRVKFPIIEGVTSYFSCSGYDTKNSPVNRDDNRKYFYSREGRVYCLSTNDHTTEVMAVGQTLFKVAIEGDTVLPKSWTDREQKRITFPLLEKSRVHYLDIDKNSSILGFNVYRTKGKNKVYFQGEVEDDISNQNPVYFLVGRDGMVIRRDGNDKDIFVQTDMDGNKGFFGVNSEGYKTYVYEHKRRYLLEEDRDGTRMYFEEDEDDKKRYYLEKIQDFQRDQHGNRIFRRHNTKEDQKVYYQTKHIPFKIDSEDSKVYLQIDYNNKQLYITKDTNGGDKFTEIHKVVYLIHDAESDPGSSGGCVLVIGKDKNDRYQCLVCMHRGKTETPRVNRAITYRLRE